MNKPQTGRQPKLHTLPTKVQTVQGFVLSVTKIARGKIGITRDTVALVLFAIAPRAYRESPALTVITTRPLANSILDLATFTWFRHLFLMIPSTREIPSILLSLLKNRLNSTTDLPLASLPHQSTIPKLDRDAMPQVIIHRESSERIDVCDGTGEGPYEDHQNRATPYTA